MDLLARGHDLTLVEGKSEDLRTSSRSFECNAMYIFMNQEAYVPKLHRP